MTELLTADQAVAGVRSGDSIMIGGWGGVGVPRQLLVALARRPVKDLTIITNNCGAGASDDVGVLFEAGLVRRVVASFPSSPAALPFRRAFANGEIELELVPQGTLVERIRCGGMGLGGVYTPTGVDTPLSAGKEVRVLGGKRHVLEEALRADVALVHAAQADAHGNLWYRYVGHAFNALMALAAETTIAEAEQIVQEIAPDVVHTPAFIVDALVGPAPETGDPGEPEGDQ
ncbi:MAG: CoA transferase subunit A [Propionibacteriaceae bacterium]|nr:CoA transferase subunit A [Propionibacteriaceae bacterium]